MFYVRLSNTACVHSQYYADYTMDIGDSVSIYAGSVLFTPPEKFPDPTPRETPRDFEFQGSVIRGLNERTTNTLQAARLPELGSIVREGVKTGTNLRELQAERGIVVDILV